MNLENSSAMFTNEETREAVQALAPYNAAVLCKRETHMRADKLIRCTGLHLLSSRDQGPRLGKNKKSKEDLLCPWDLGSGVVCLRRPGPVTDLKTFTPRPRSNAPLRQNRGRFPNLDQAAPCSDPSERVGAIFRGVIQVKEKTRDSKVHRGVFEGEGRSRNDQDKGRHPTRGASRRGRGSLQVGTIVRALTSLAHPSGVFFLLRSFKRRTFL